MSCRSTRHFFLRCLWHVLMNHWFKWCCYYIAKILTNVQWDAPQNMVHQHHISLHTRATKCGILAPQNIVHQRHKMWQTNAHGKGAPTHTHIILLETLMEEKPNTHSDNTCRSTHGKGPQHTLRYLWKRSWKSSPTHTPIILVETLMRKVPNTFRYLWKRSWKRSPTHTHNTCGNAHGKGPQHTLK
jgi:hypothetical protein